MKIKLLLLTIFVFHFVTNAQPKKYQVYTKNNKSVSTYFAFGNLKEAREVRPDSVKGLRLCCEKLRAFPNEVLNYKNLTYLSFAPEYFDSLFVYSNLSEEEKQMYQQRKKAGEDLHFYYQFNAAFIIPNEITQLNKLEVLILSFDPNELNESMLPEVKKLEALLPKVNIKPSSSEIEKEMKNTLNIIEDK